MSGKKELREQRDRLERQLVRSNERLAEYEHQAYQYGTQGDLIDKLNKEYNLNWSIAEQLEDVKTALFSLVKD